MKIENMTLRDQLLVLANVAFYILHSFHVTFLFIREALKTSLI